MHMYICMQVYIIMMKYVYIYAYVCLYLYRIANKENMDEDDENKLFND